MIIPIAAFVILLFYATLEYLWGERRKCWSSYIMWFFVILGSMYFAKAYAYEDKIENHYDHSPVKFVPEGTPHEYINDDNTLSRACLRVIRSTDRQTAKQSFKIHVQKGKYFYKEGKDGCWLLPIPKQRDLAKMAFATSVAAIPGPIGVRLVAATLSCLAQYGICCIDEYYNIEHNLNMAHFHFRMADAFHDHMQKNGWLK